METPLITPLKKSERAQEHADRTAADNRAIWDGPDWNTKIDPFDILVPDPDTGALKADGKKLRYDLVPVQALEEIVMVLNYGAEKYADRNWEKGMAWSRPFAACMRHLWAWWRGESNDKDSGLSHLSHAACNILFLLEFQHTFTKGDDRP